VARGYFSVAGIAQTISTAITALEMTCPSNGVLFVDRIWLEQTTVTAVGTRARAQILFKTAACTGTASPPAPTSNDSLATSGVSVRWVATAEGTAGDIKYDESFDYVAGYLWTPSNARERIVVFGGGNHSILALKFPAAPTSASWTFGFAWDEYV